MEVLKDKTFVPESVVGSSPPPIRENAFVMRSIGPVGEVTQNIKTESKTISVMQTEIILFFCKTGLLPLITENVFFGVYSPEKK